MARTRVLAWGSASATRPADALGPAVVTLEGGVDQVLDEVGIPDARRFPHLRVHRDRREPGDGVHLVDQQAPAVLLVEEVDAGHAIDPEGVAGGQGHALDLL